MKLLHKSLDTVRRLWRLLKYRHYGNPRAHGAKGDGVTNDTAALQACVNGNLGIYLRTGTYVVTSPIELLAGRHLVGEPGRSAIMRPQESLDA